MYEAKYREIHFTKTDFYIFLATITSLIILLLINHQIVFQVFEITGNVAATNTISKTSSKLAPFALVIIIALTISRYTRKKEPQQREEQQPSVIRIKGPKYANHPDHELWAVRNKIMDDFEQIISRLK